MNEETPIPRGSLPIAGPPADLWAGIQEEVDGPTRRALWPWAVAAAITVSVIGGWFFVRPSRPTWDVVRVVAGAETRVAGWLRSDWVETGTNGRAQIHVGSIGVVEVEPNSRVRVVVAKETEHRLELGQGVIEVRRRSALHLVCFS